MSWKMEVGWETAPAWWCVDLLGQTSPNPRRLGVNEVHINGHERYQEVDTSALKSVSHFSALMPQSAPWCCSNALIRTSSVPNPSRVLTSQTGLCKSFDSAEVSRTFYWCPQPCFGSGNRFPPLVGSGNTWMTLFFPTHQLGQESRFKA